MTQNKTTIYDIAKLGGASPGTVSAVLNGTWKQRRIGEKTASRIQQIADEHGYTLNLQARGLRKARSGMAGFIVPVHDNRFFSSMSHAFEAEARNRGLCPVIASTSRDPEQEARTVETLIAYAIDFLFIAGASDPDTVSAMCKSANVPYVFLDLPGENARSVVSNNYGGAEMLTRRILETMPSVEDPRLAKPYYIGGGNNDYASTLRLKAFKDIVLSTGGQLTDDQILLCGYAPSHAESEIAGLCERLGGLPSGLFINSIRTFEGILSYFVNKPADFFANTSVGVYDYDPVSAFLQFPVHMVRQDSRGLVSKAFELLDSKDESARLIIIEPELVAPRTIYGSFFSDIG